MDDTVIVYIDVVTGTYGDASGLYFMNAERGAEAAMLFDTLQDKSDSEIAEYAKTGGVQIKLF